MLGDVVNEGPESMSIRPGRQMKRLGDFQTFFQVAPDKFFSYVRKSLKCEISNLPSTLVYGQQCRAFVLRVIGNNDTDKQRQTNHAAQKDEDVNVNGVNLDKSKL